MGDPIQPTIHDESLYECGTYCERRYAWFFSFCETGNNCHPSGNCICFSKTNGCVDSDLLEMYDSYALYERPTTTTTLLMLEDDQAEVDDTMTISLSTSIPAACCCVCIFILWHSRKIRQKEVNGPSKNKIG